MKIFIIHYKKLVNRKKYLLEQFQRHNITDYEFIEIDRDELCNQNIEIFEENYSKSQIAISLSHFYAYKEISEKYDEGLIFEDDVILSDNFTDILMKSMSELPKDYDMLFIGNGCDFHIEKHKIMSDKYIYEKCLYPTTWGGDGATRCTDSYLVNKKCAIKLYNYIENLTYKINMPINWWLNNTARENVFKVYWLEPTIVTQGTQSGLYESSH